MKFKISEEQKNELLKNLDIEEEVTSFIKNFCFGLEKIKCDEIKNVALKEIKDDIDILKSENILSEQLVRFFRKIIDIDINDEELEEVESKLNDEAKVDRQKFIEQAKKEHKISKSMLKMLISLNYQKKDGVIDLDSNMTEMLKKVDKYRTISSYEKKNETERIEENLKKGKIEYRDYIKLTEEHNLDYESKGLQITEKLLSLYNGGIISEEYFYKSLGNAENNLGVKKFDEKYELFKEIKLKDDIEKAIDIMKNLPDGVSKETREKMSRLLEKIEKNENKNVNQLEEYVEKFNEISNEEWQKYLERKNGILFHSTNVSIHGNYTDHTMSTSLIEKEHFKTYKGNIGYKIKPKVIIRAAGRDTYELNQRRDKYAATSSILVNLPQSVSNEMMEKETYSEVDTTEYLIESAFIIDPKDKTDLKKIKEMAKAQGLHIDTFDGEKFVGIEEYFLDKQTSKLSKDVSNIKNYKNTIGKLGLEKFDSEEEFIKSEISNYIFEIEMQKKDWTRKKQITCAKNIKLIGNLDGNVEEINSKLFEKYQVALDKKVQELIQKDKIDKVEKQTSKLEKKKFNIIDKLLGKQRLNNARIELLKLKKEEIELEEIEGIAQEKESIKNLMEYCKQNRINPNMKQFLKSYSEICENTDIKENIGQLLEEKQNENEEHNLEENEKKSFSEIRRETNNIEQDIRYYRMENENKRTNQKNNKFRRDMQISQNGNLEKMKQVSKQLSEMIINNEQNKINENTR